MSHADQLEPTAKLRWVRNGKEYTLQQATKTSGLDMALWVDSIIRNTLIGISIGHDDRRRWQ